MPDLSTAEHRRRVDGARDCLVSALGALQWPPRYGDALLYALMAATHLSHLADVSEAEKRWAVAVAKVRGASR
jgi:hypothetical protein